MNDRRWFRLSLPVVGDIVVADTEVNLNDAEDANPGCMAYTRKETDVMDGVGPEGFNAVHLVKQAFRGTILTPKEVEREFRR